MSPLMQHVERNDHWFTVRHAGAIIDRLEELGIPYAYTFKVKSPVPATESSVKNALIYVRD